MSYDFKYGRLWLSEFNGFTSKKPDIDIAEYDYTLVDTPGKDGSDCVDNHRYKNVLFSREVVFNAQKNRRLEGMTDRLKNWLAYFRGYQDFEDTLHPGMITQAILKNQAEIVSLLDGRINTATLKFSRMPYWYRKDALEYREADLTEASATFINPYPAEAEPIIYFRFDGSSTDPATITYTVTTGGATAEYSMANIPVSNSVDLFVDCQKQEIRSGQGASLKYLDGSLPRSFAEGSTAVAVTAGKNRLSALYVMPRWRCL